MTATDTGRCCEHDLGMTRRVLLRRAAVLGTAATATTMFGDVLSQAVYGDTSTNKNTLVVLSLRGGADGLSLVVPHAESAYYAARPSISFAPDSLILADQTFGLHPSFSQLAPLWTAGQFAAIHAVGMASPNRSHFSAQEELEEATPGSSARVGWLNRMISSLGGGAEFEAVALGTALMPTALCGSNTPIATPQLAALTVPYSSNQSQGVAQASALSRMYAGAPALLRTTARAALKLASDAKPVARCVSDTAPYPVKSDLAEALKNAAGLIRADVGTRAIAIDFGGWDHHVNLKSRIATQINEMCACLAAFFSDLGSTLSENVTVITLTEFGRRLAQNGAAGADHGYANAVFAIGGGVKGGRYYARWPGLGSTTDGDLTVTTDYRSILSEIISQRFPEVSIAKVFPDFTPEAPLGFISSSTSS